MIVTITYYDILRNTVTNMKVSLQGEASLFSSFGNGIKVPKHFVAYLIT